MLARFEMAAMGSKGYLTTFRRKDQCSVANLHFFSRVELATLNKYLFLFFRRRSPLKRRNLAEKSKRVPPHQTPRTSFKSRTQKRNLPDPKLPHPFSPSKSSMDSLAQFQEERRHLERMT